jgi:hypothetical protein
VADAGEDVIQRTVDRLGETHPVGGDDRHVIRGGQIAQRVVVGFLVAQEVPLQLEIRAPAAEHADEPIDEAADAEPRAAQHRAPTERDEAGRMAVEFVERERAFSFR